MEKRDMGEVTGKGRVRNTFNLLSWRIVSHCYDIIVVGNINQLGLKNGRNTKLKKDSGKDMGCGTQNQGKSPKQTLESIGA
jgi:hypothetical protein